MPGDDRYSLTELADLARVTPRTIRYYLAQGLLPATSQSGPRTTYDAGHLARLRLIRRLQGEHLPLAEIRHRLEDLGDDEVRELAGLEPPAPPADSALDYVRSVLGGPAPLAAAAPLIEPSPTESAPAPSGQMERSQWERVVLSPDVELHIRRPLVRAQNKQVDRLVTIARELLEEDRS